MQYVSRRAFIKQSSVAAAGVSAFATTRSRAQSLGEKLVFGLIGCGGRGRYVAREMIQQNTHCKYLCDLQADRASATAQFLSDVQPEQPALVKDMQTVYDDRDVDFVVVATPDHWHAAASVRACRAGKDVYCEKPHSLTIWESRQMIRAADRFQRILQVGTQNRSAPYTQQAREVIRSGKIGDVRLVKIYNLKPGGGFKLGASKGCPDDFAWDQWLGGAPQREYHSRIVHGGWHHYWDFCGGDITDDGIHQADLAMMLMGDPGVPKSATFIANRLHHQGDDSEVPDVGIASFEFEAFVCAMEQSNYPRYMRKTSATIRRNDEMPYWTQNSTRIELYGSDLLMIVGRHGGGWITMTSGGKVVDKVFGRPADTPHAANFVDCVKTRKKPTASVDVVHNAITMLHAANISHRIGNTTVKLDPKTEQFVNNDAANAMLKRAYREPYAFPAL